MCIRDSLAPVAGLLHKGLARHFSCSDAADHDVDMDVSRMVVSIGVGADECRTVSYTHLMVMFKGLDDPQDKDKK